MGLVTLNALISKKTVDTYYVQDRSLKTSFSVNCSQTAIHKEAPVSLQKLRTHPDAEIYSNHYTETF